MLWSNVKEYLFCLRLKSLKYSDKFLEFCNSILKSNQVQIDI